MSTPFQNRLVGTIIVAAAVIIFLPDILDGKKESHQADFEAIPEAPAFKGSSDRHSFPEDKLALIEKTELVDETAIDESGKVEQQEQATNKKEQQTAANNTKTKITPLTQDNIKQTAAIITPEAIKTSSEPKNKAASQNAWVIHLGSFKHKKNVDELLAKLKANGYTAFTKPIKTRHGVLTKVVVGPSLNKVELEKKLPALKSLTKVQGKIAKFKTR